MSTTVSQYLTGRFILGVFLLSLVAFGYVPIVIYYGWGLPFVQIIFLAFYIIGVRAIQHSAAPGWAKWGLYVAPAIWLAAMQWGNLTL